MVKESNLKQSSVPRVCLVCNTAWAIYTYRQGLLRALCAAGVEVIILAPRDRTFEALAALGCRCIDIPVASKSTNPFDDLRTLWILFGHYRKLKPNLVFHYTIKANIFGTLAAWLARVQSVAVTTGLGYAFIQKTLAASVAHRLYRLAFRFPREIWFLNADDHQAFLDQNLLVYPGRARLLHGEGVDLSFYAVSPLPEAEQTSLRFILIGRLLWDKGVGEFVEAARSLRLRCPQVRCQLLGSVGADNPSAIGRDQIDAWVAEGAIDYLGETDDVRPIIAAATCVVLPSYREGVPRTLMEAAAMGRPIVATRVPGCKEVVDDGVTGLLCEARNAVDLAEKMAHIAALPAAERHQMGLAGRTKVVREFDEKLVIDRYFTTLAALTGCAVFTQPDNPIPSAETR
jgi:glycosyltransferase involved in cell wall biosynthesis